MLRANVELRMLGTGALLCLAGAQVSALSAQQSDGVQCEHWNTPSLPSGFVARCLAAGADPNARDATDGYTPLHWANSADDVAALVAEGTNLNARDFLGHTPLHMAVYTPLFARSVDAVVALLAAGADPTARNNNGETPLHRADSADDVAPLLAAGAMLNARDNVGETPLHEATEDRIRNADVAAALLAAGADPNARDNYGHTPLHSLAFYAASGFNFSLNSQTAGVDEIEEEFMARDVEVARVLLAAGADPNARDANGATPLDRMGSAFEELGVGPRPPLYWLLNDVTAR
ncbi:MAG: hypothetical protein F4020_03765 [Gammaproteobacteria bacterium]|nr:hypothetical protein [Gammaproteobacteria bacterium]MYK68688.1 hypothetical protein [Gammaproteobacteria bacterium]